MLNRLNYMMKRKWFSWIGFRRCVDRPMGINWKPIRSYYLTDALRLCSPISNSGNSLKKKMLLEKAMCCSSYSINGTLIVDGGRLQFRIR
uniref:Ovule protein n=1 Tax=Ascaris lumbricoides TaxID=6252 RepID=A0A0M3HK01_ASCLU